MHNFIDMGDYEDQGVAIDQKGIWHFAKNVTYAHLGMIPEFLHSLSRISAKEQINQGYCSGWHPLNGFQIASASEVGLLGKPWIPSIKYPGDPVMRPMAWIWMVNHPELVVLYPSAFMGIFNISDMSSVTFEVARID